MSNLIERLRIAARNKVFTPRMVRVDSSAIAEVGYDRNRRSLLVRFRDHKTGEPERLYEYGCADRRIFRELLAADSKGRFFSANIRNNEQLPFRRVIDA